jgi:hypothetical protein
MKKPKKRKSAAGVASVGERVQSRRVSEMFREDLWSLSRQASDLEASSALDVLNDLRASELRGAAAAETLLTEAAARLLRPAPRFLRPAARLLGGAAADASGFAFAHRAEVWYTPLTGPGFA